MSAALSLDDKRLQRSVLFAVAVHSLFILFFTVFLFQHANPMGDGMEMVGSSIAFMFIFLPFSLPAYLLAKTGRLLILAALLALIASFLYFGLWLEFLDQLGIQPAPWNADSNLASAGHQNTAVDRASLGRATFAVTPSIGSPRPGTDTPAIRSISGSPETMPSSHGP